MKHSTRKEKTTRQIKNREKAKIRKTRKEKASRDADAEDYFWNGDVPL
jgi:hypothetical protein